MVSRVELDERAEVKADMTVVARLDWQKAEINTFHEIVDEKGDINTVQGRVKCLYVRYTYDIHFSITKTQAIYGK